ncbi:hypothetical protein JBL43_11305 [Aureibaculum sp. A20]|uniref:Uncharacterized protein n=1 Tax=Aureibaculum flavum TaxID=2795986 RepID=A0ABS0WS62_9FLAO|nr:hypothetical protein [Aureibaculum flavum]MBJ2174827.1 hypothetical protein [Aureibaculum flavum]
MGHRTYLSIHTKSEDGEMLFEANNSLPFFWIGLMDNKQLDAIKPIWKKIEELSMLEDESLLDNYYKNEPEGACIKIDKASFIKNANRTLLFLEKYASESVPLFKDFVKYIRSKFAEPNQYLLLDIFEIANFSTLEEFTITIQTDINTIETQNLQAETYLMRYDLIAGGTGFSYSKEFEDIFPNYSKAKKDRRIPNFPSKKVVPTKKSLINNIIILLLTPFFTYIVYRGYIKDGFSFWVITIGFINLSFYVYTIINLIQISKALKLEK